MVSFFSKLFGGGGQSPAGEPQRGEAVAYQGLTIRAAPMAEDSQWRLAGFILKDEGQEGEMERHFVRADLLASREEAETFALRKGKQVIDERGEGLFADGEKSGRA